MSWDFFFFLLEMYTKITLMVNSPQPLILLRNAQTFIDSFVCSTCECVLDKALDLVGGFIVVDRRTSLFQNSFFLVIVSF